MVATAATTVFGAFDPLKEIASICERFSIWMHVDGCFGSSILMSRKHRSIADGIERFAVNVHIIIRTTYTLILLSPQKCVHADISCQIIIMHDCN